MENLLIPYQAVKKITAHRVLVFAPHPDDEVFGCGGAILHHTAENIPVRVIIVTNGGYGINPSELSDYVRQRQNESINAASVLNYGKPVFWHYNDRDLHYGETLITEILSAIHDTRADLVYAPSVYEIHPDHRALGMATMEAVRRSEKQIKLALYEIGQPIQPNLLLDISDLAERKMEAMRCFISQNAKQRYDLDIAALNRYRTYTLPAEVTAAEAYILTNSEELASDPLKLYQSEHARQQKAGLALDTEDLPLVSVIIRSMDRHTLSDALDSVALQTYPNIEVVLVNAKGHGHSAVGDWCGRFPLRMTSNTEPLHRSKAANTGLETARGKYLIFLDDDDFFNPDHIATLVSELKTHKRFRCAYTGVRVDYYIDDQLVSATQFNEPFDQRKLWGRNFIPIHAMLFEHTLVTEGSAFDENLDILEDWDFWIQIAQRCKILHIDKITAVYRNHGDSGMGSKLDETFLQQARSKVFEKWKSQFSGKQLEDMILYWEEKAAVLNEQIAVKKQEIRTIQNRIKQLEQEQHTHALHEQSLQKTISALQSANRNLTNTITEFTQSSSWKITAPLRFLVRILRGQRREAWNGFRRRILPIGGKIFRLFPARLRLRMLPIIYRLTGPLFKGTEHYESWRIQQNDTNQLFPSHARGTLTGLTDIADIAPLDTFPTGRIAIHAHIFYADLINEFGSFLENMPYRYDLFISTSNETDKQACQRTFSGLPHLNQLTITVVPNRGRDIAPLFCTFGNELQQYDYIAHIHSKKSLYSHGAADGWREYLLTHLLGSSEQIRKIFTLLTSDKNIGFVYPQNFSVLPYWANTWLSNKTRGHAWCKKLGIASVPSGYFDFPAGSMFWAQTKALQPLFNAQLKIEDFPEEAGQNDATLAHCIERLFVLTTRHSGLNTVILKDNQSPNWSRWRIDQYLLHQKEKIHAILQRSDIRIVVFDIFDTLITRPLLNPEHVKAIVARRAGGRIGERYLEFRAMAENQARQIAGRDVGLDSIFRELGILSGLSADEIEQLHQLEITIETSIVAPRQEAVDLFRFAQDLGKRVILASDMYLPQPVIENMLIHCGISGWHAFYLSAANGLRKDTGDFYHQLLNDEQVSANSILIIGDNEQSDAQKPGDMKFHVTHVMRPVELARATPRLEPIIENAFAPPAQNDLNTQLTLGAIVQANFRPLFYPQFNPADFVPASPWAVGYTVAGPLVLSFVQWLAKQVKTYAIQRLFFLAREGEILKIVYDLWTSEDPHAVASEYLVLSRRAVTVPMIANLDDIFTIAGTHYAPNPMPDFISERFGLHLSENECEELAQRKLWPKKKPVTVKTGEIDHLKPLLQALEKRILNQAENERPGLMAYLQNIGFNPDTTAAIVDVGYAATTQGKLNQLLTQKIHGYYMMTLDRAERIASAHQVITQGYYCHYAKPSATEPVIYRKSFTIEKFLSADTAQIISYHRDDYGNVLPEFRTQTPEERQSAETRAEIRRGIIDFTQQVVTIRDDLLPDIEIPPHIAESLFLAFVNNPSQSENNLLRSLVLDDYYYGHGLVR